MWLRRTVINDVIKMGQSTPCIITSKGDADEKADDAEDESDQGPLGLKLLRVGVDDEGCGGVDQAH